jgi:hypothetical protein
MTEPALTRTQASLSSHVFESVDCPPHEPGDDNQLDEAAEPAAAGVEVRSPEQVHDVLPNPCHNLAAVPDDNRPYGNGKREKDDI